MTGRDAPPLPVAAGAAAAVRLAFSGLFMVRPDTVARALDVPASPVTRTVARVVAARELVLGVGALSALARSARVRPWLLAMAAADALNGTVTLAAALRGAVPLRRALPLAAFDLSGTAWELALARGSTARDRTKASEDTRRPRLS